MPEPAFTLPGIRVHLPRNRCSRSPESVFTMLWNGCSPSAGICVHDAPEYAIAYLRKVKEADFFIWLIGRNTTQPVVDEVNACIAAGRRLLAFKFPAAHRDERTRALVDDVATYVKWQNVQDIDDFASHLKIAVSDEFIRALRDPDPPARKHRLEELMRLSLATCKLSWTTLGVSDDIAAALARDQSLGKVLPLPDSGVTLIVGDVGTGKTLAVSRLFQHAVARALDDSSQPFPLFVNARALQEPVNDYIHRMGQGFCRPSVQPILIVIDGLDEIGVTRANDLLTQIQASADANVKLTAVVTSRQLPGLKDVRPRLEMPVLDDDAIIHLISRIASRQVGLSETHTWSDSTRDAARHPLFAVMIGSELFRRSDFHFSRKSQLVNSLAEAALPASRDDAATVDRLLQLLAVKTIDAGRRVSKSTISLRRSDQSFVTNSRLVNEHDGAVDFTLSIFREWYAARAVIEQTVSLDDIQSLSDRWIIPFAIAISSENHDVQHTLMRKLASSDPGLASLVMVDTDDEWQHGDDARVFENSATAMGWLLRNAMNDWSDGLGELFRAIGPVRADGRVTTIGIRIDLGVVTTSWYDGPDELPPVVELPERACMNYESGWNVLVSETISCTTRWPWSTTKGYLADSLSEFLKSKWFALESNDAVRELAWVLALAVKRSGSLDPTPINLREVLSVVNAINRAVDDPMGRRMSVSVGTAKFSNYEVTLVKRHLSTLVDRGDRLIADPWPSADLLTDSGRWVWDLYSDERLLERTIAVYSAALRIYKTMVDKWFGAFRNRLQLNQLLPVRLEGRLTPSREPDATNCGPGLNLRTKSLPVGEQSSVAFDLGPEDEFDVWSYWRDEQRNLSHIRPESGTTLAPIVSMSGLHIFNGRPAAELAHQWLINELHQVGWSKQSYAAP